MGVAAAETHIAWQSHEGLRIARIRGRDVIHCVMCGFRHVVPLPDAHAFERSYRDPYMHEAGSVVAFPRADEENRPAPSHCDLLESFERILGNSQRRLLEIGAGRGEFLAAAKARGWRVLGVEASQTAAAQAHAAGIGVTEGFFNSETAPGLGRFDTIRLNGVLEHAPSPVEILLLTRNLLERGGVLCVDIPDEFLPSRVSARTGGGSPEWPTPHLNHFDFDTLSDLLARLDFAPVECAGFERQAIVIATRQ